MFKLITFCFILVASAKAGRFKRSADNNHFLDHERNEVNYDFPEVINVKKLFTDNGIEHHEAWHENTNQPHNKGSDEINHKLPDVVDVKKYTIQLSVYLDEEPSKNFSFDGIVDIDFELKDQAQNITFHLEKSTLNSVELSGDDYQDKPLLAYYQPATHFVAAHMPKRMIQPGNYTLKLKYNGTVNDEELGLFKRSYVNENNEKKWFALTFLGPNYARQVFPCFDEPKYKAIFDLSINHHEKYSAISNTEVNTRSEPDSNGRVVTSFKPTPKMSTYDLAFVISDFAKVTNENSGHSIYARTNAIKETAYALEMEAKIMKKMEELIGVSLDQSKIDLVAVPGLDWGSAMENWGLVIMDELFLLRNDTSEDFDFDIVYGITYGYARQWFGNLVSPEDWKYIWLTEGLASYFEMNIIKELGLSGDSWDNFWTYFLNFLGLRTDSFEEAHPVHNELQSLEDVRDVIENDYYVKPIMMVRMMEHILTHKIFHKGLALFLNKNKYGTVNSDDLFEAMEAVIKKEEYELPYDFKTIMDSWLDYKGYPILNVVRDYDTNIVNITQERFFLYDPSDEEKNDRHLWYVPITIATKSNSDFNSVAPELWLKDSSLSVPVKADDEEWIILNKKFTGFYRINYDEMNWKLLTDFLKAPKREKIHPLNRAQLMDDALTFYQLGNLGVQTIFDLADGLTNEKDFTVWIIGVDVLDELDETLINTKYYPQFKKNVQTILKTILEEVGIEESETDNYPTMMIRDDVLRQECRAGNPTVIENMKNKLESWLEHSSEIPEGSLMFYCGLRDANSDTWKKVFNTILEKTYDEYDEALMTEGLTVTAEKDLLTFLLNESLEFDFGDYETLDIMQLMMENSPVGVDVVLDFISDNVDDISDEEEKESYNDILEMISDYINNNEQLEKLKALMYSDSPKSILADAKENIRWLEDNEEKLEKWLNI